LLLQCEEFFPISENIADMKLFSVKNKKIVITGATGVLGESMARHLAKEGAQVIIVGRTPSKVEKLIEAFKKRRGKS
jgi:short-subunit dehydrogenase